MLKMLRKNTKLIIWFIIISFCLWGAFSVGVQMNQRGQIAGRVFGRPISFQEFNKFLKASEIFSLTGEPVKDPGILQQHAWQNIIFASEAKRRKIKVSDNEVRDEIKRLLTAQNVPMDDAAYQAWVRSISGTTPRNFEEMVRETLRIQKLLQEIRKMPAEIDPNLDLRKQFLRDRRELATEAIIFTDAARAQGFYEAALKNSDWRNMVSQPGGPLLQNLGLQSLENLSITYGLNDNQIQELYALTKESLSPPQATASGRVILFRITDKKEVAESEFDTIGTADKYREELVERKRYQNFLNWHNDLIQRSRFEDLSQPG